MTSKHSIRCKICNDPKRESIEKDIQDGLSLREISARYGCSENTITRHKEAFSEEEEQDEVETVPAATDDTPQEFLRSVIRKSKESRSVKVGDGITAAKELARLEKSEADPKTQVEEAILNAIEQLKGFSAEQLDQYIERVENLVKNLESVQSTQTRE